MKKIIIGATAFGLSIALVGCGKGANNAAITNLCSQLDDTANTISNVQTVNPTDINLSKEALDTIATRDNSQAIYDNVIGTQQSLLNEEYYKMDILNKTATLKNNLSKDLKLSKTQINAVKELTSNLSKYTNSVAYTKNEMNSTIKTISSLKKNVDKNSDRINAKLNRLACNSNTRSAYYENILNTLSQLETYLNCNDCTSNDNQNNIQEEQNNQNEVAQQNATENTKASKNIDTYLPNYANNNQNIAENTNQNCPNCTPMNQPFAYNSNNFNRANTGIYENAAYYPNNYGFGYANRFGTPYNANNMNYARFNPGRNTDTYAPMQRNIDTYRFGNGTNGMYGAGYGTLAPEVVAPVTTEPKQETEPEKRLESFEEVNENNIVEAVKEPEVEQTESKIEEANAAEIKKDFQETKQCFLQTSSEDELNQTTIAHTVER